MKMKFEIKKENENRKFKNMNSDNEIMTYREIVESMCENVDEYEEKDFEKTIQYLIYLGSIEEV